MKHYSQMSQQECRRAETTADRITNLRGVIGCLEMAEQGSVDEGLYLTGDIPQMIQTCKLAIRQLEESYLEGE